MKTNHTVLAAVALAMTGALPAAQAHVSFVNNRAPAGTSFIATANISHGCGDEGGAGLDTTRVEIVLPEGVTARPMHSDIGDAAIDGNTLVWAREAPVQEADTHFYQVSFRFTVPNAPFTRLQFMTTQFCGDAELAWGAESPMINIVPARAPGWNRYTAQSDIQAADFSAYFGDAEIVWTIAPRQAYSANPHVAPLIQDPLQIIPAGANFWVKY